MTEHTEKLVSLQGFGTKDVKQSTVLSIQYSIEEMDGYGRRYAKPLLSITINGNGPWVYDEFLLTLTDGANRFKEKLING